MYKIHQCNYSWCIFVNTNRCKQGCSWTKDNQSDKMNLLANGWGNYEKSLEEQMRGFRYTVLGWSIKIQGKNVIVPLVSTRCPW